MSPVETTTNWSVLVTPRDACRYQNDTSLEDKHAVARGDVSCEDNTEFSEDHKRVRSIVSFYIDKLLVVI